MMTPIFDMIPVIKSHEMDNNNSLISCVRIGVWIISDLLLQLNNNFA